jgi:hypothetical protein
MERAGAEPPRSVSDWMELTAEHRTDLFQRTAENARTDAMVALAMFEAANAIEKTYPSYVGLAPVPTATDADVAVASAATAVLSALYPEDAPVFANAFAKSVATENRDGEFAAAQRLGREAAEAAMRRGQTLESARLTPFRTTTPPGAYIPEGTPSLITDFDLALKPWALESTDAARAGPPPPLTSASYARDLNEVRRLGAKTDHARSDAETEAARFWFLIDMNPILRQIADAPGRSASKNARLYAMFYMATDDAWTASGDAKTHYQLWRPITAIRSADRDGNDRTDRDPYWEPFLPTPPHPEYPCAHCVQAAAQAVILEAELGDASRSFLIASSTLPGAEPRRVTSRDYVEQTSLSRIYAGAHYRFSNDAGEDTGKAVGEAVLRRWSYDD